MVGHIEEGQLRALALSTYVGLKCQRCDLIYKDVETLIKTDPIFIGNNKYMCKECYNK